MCLIAVRCPSGVPYPSVGLGFPVDVDDEDVTFCWAHAVFKKNGKYEDTTVPNAMIREMLNTITKSLFLVFEYDIVDGVVSTVDGNFS